MEATDGSNGRVRLTVDDGVAELRLSHPEKLNCFSRELAADLHELVFSLPGRDDVSAIVVTAAGRAFSAGVDVNAIGSGDADAVDAIRAGYEPVFEWMHDGPVPVVVGGRGPVVGAGAGLLCYAADLQVVGTDARIWFPEVAYGIAPLEWTAYLTAKIGDSRALEVMLLGEHGALDAETARELGLVNRVVAPDDVDDAARDLARVIAEYDREHDIAGDFLEAVQHTRREGCGASVGYAGRVRGERKRRRRDAGLGL